MPRILLCSATSFEIAPTVDRLHEFVDVEICITGVGLMETAFRLSDKIAAFQPDLMIQAGFAGLLNDDHQLGSVVAIRRDTIGDLGVEEHGAFRSMYALGFGPPDIAPWEEAWLVNNSNLLSATGLPLVDAVSVNEITTDADRISYYRNIGAVAESMEGAAFHYAALRRGIPFVQLRAFSNAIGERDKTRWQIAECISNLNRELLDLLQRLTQNQSA